MFPNLKFGASTLLSASCFLTLSAAACSDPPEDNDLASTEAAAASGGAGGARTSAAGRSGSALGARSESAAAGSAGSWGPATGTAGTRASDSPSVEPAADASGNVAAGSGAAGSAAAGSGAAGGAAASSGSEAGAGAAGSDGATAPGADASLVTGTGASCQSYTEATADKCGGWYCGVDQATLTAAVDPSTVCGGNVELLCNNSVVLKVGECARTIKAEMLTATNEELRPPVRDCVFEDATIKMGATPECVDCLIDAASCASDNCLTQCLTGDSEGCDSCRIENGCDQMVFSCGGLPAPI
jgi:hypothetical protein